MRSRTTRREFPGAAAAIALAVLLPASGCGGARRTASEAILAFVDAVQSEDPAALRCRLAGAAGDADDVAFAEWLASRYVEYESGRDAGRVELGDDGIPLVKAFALGKGAFWQVDRVEQPDSRTLLAVMTVRFGYPSIDLSGLAPGTVFYVCGTPLGRIHAVEVPRTTGRVDLEVLDAIRVRWTLVFEPAADGCPSRFSVAAVEPIEDSVETARVAWVF